jgi:NADH-quinone oxidoreductase subunit I
MADERKKKEKELSVTAFILKPMLVTMREGLRTARYRPNTVQYPWEKLVIPDNYRGRPGLVMDRCIGCGICMRICPTRCIELVEIEVPEKGKVKRPQVNIGRCMMCGYCAEYCPKNAMIVTPDYELAAYSRRDLIYDPIRLQHEVKPGYEVNVFEIKPSELKAGGMAVDVKQVTGYKDYPVVDEKKCIGCSKCEKVCPADAAHMEQKGVNEKGRPIKRPTFDQAKCVSCQMCMENCPKSAINMKEVK